MRDLPGGTVTFLFTDIEGSTPLYQSFPDALPRAMTRHHEILREAIGGHNGVVFNIIGDAFCAAFSEPWDALRAALEAQRALHSENWRELGSLRVRMGLHTGAAQARDDDYISSLTLVRVQRIMSAGHGGQTLLSSPTAELVRAQLPPSVTLRELGTFKLRGLQQPEPLFQILAPDLPSEFPPLRAIELGRAPEALTPLEQLVQGKIVGREGEFAQLQQQWQSAEQGRAHLVLLSGEPGVGKTRLATELMQAVQSLGAPVLRGGCYEYEATTPYLPFVEALRDWVHATGAEQLRVTLGDTAPEIVKLAPEIETKLGALPASPPLSPNEERLRLFDHIARVLRNIAAPRGLVLFLDDLHWADRGTIHLLHYLLRHLRGDRVMLLGAYREVELDRAHPLAAALIDWNREHLATRLSLSRLSRGDTGALVAALFGQESISDEFVQGLFRETEGNPFFIEEVVKSLIEQGQIYRENNQWQRKQIADLAIPQSVKEAIGRRLSRLTENCVDALRTAAALGKIFPFVELRAVVATNEDQLLDALDEANAAQLLRTDANDTFAFTHDKIREVLYEELNPIRRRRLHQRIGEGLEKLYPAPNGHTSDLAYHFTQSGDLEKSLDYSVSAAQNAERVFAHDDALKFYQQAREAADTLQRADALMHIDEQIGDVYRVRGDITPAVVHYEQAYTRAFAIARRAALNVKIGMAYAPVGDVRGMAALENALGELDPQAQPAQYASALALIGRYHHYHTHHTRAIEYLERALALAEPLDDVETLGNIYSFFSGAYQHLTRYQESNVWARRSIAIGERKNYPEAIAIGYEFLAENAFGCGYWEDTIRFAQKDREIGAKISSLARVGWAEMCLTSGQRGLGDLRAAEASALRGLEIAEQIGESRLACWIEPELARALADLGNDDDAKKFAEQGLAHSKALGQIVLRVWAIHGLAYAHLRRHQFETAADLYEQCFEILGASENRVARNFIAAHSAHAYFRAGRSEQAVQEVNTALELAQAAQSPYHLALALDVQGQILTAQEDWSGAQDTFDRAVNVLQALHSRPDLARVLEHRAAFYRMQREDERAASDEARSLALFDETGAKR